VRMIALSIVWKRKATQPSTARRKSCFSLACVMNAARRSRKHRHPQRPTVALYSQEKPSNP